jgi:hypothetical protein
LNLSPVNFLANTALESPALPTITSVAVIIAEQAVHPAPYAISSFYLPNKDMLESLFFL